MAPSVFEDAILSGFRWSEIGPAGGRRLSCNDESSTFCVDIRRRISDAVAEIARLETEKDEGSLQTRAY
jgi:hypothetical protein